MHLWIVFDIVVLLIFSVCIIHSMRQGFIKASSTILSIVLTISIMFAFQDEMREGLMNSFVGEYVSKTITTSFMKKDEMMEPTTDENKENSFGLPGFINDLVGDSQKKVENAKNDFLDDIKQSAVTSVINILSILILYIAVKIALFIILKIINAIFKLPLLRSVNKLLGALIGFTNGLFIVYILCALMILFVPNDTTKNIHQEIEKTYITKVFYDNNLLLKLFM